MSRGARSARPFEPAQPESLTSPPGGRLLGDRPPSGEDKRSWTHPRHGRQVDQPTLRGPCGPTHPAVLATALLAPSLRKQKAHESYYVPVLVRLTYTTRDMDRSTSRPSRTRKLQRLFELAATQAGHFTAAQAHELGYSARSLVHHVGAGHFERIGRGFYRLVGTPADPHEDIVAAWLRFAPRGAVVSHDTALALYDLAPARPHGIHLTLPRERRLRTARPATAVTLHTTTVPLRRDEVTNRFGVELTSPARTIADVADLGTDPSVVIEATARALATGLVSSNELRTAVRRRAARVRQLVARAIEDAATRA